MIQRFIYQSVSLCIMVKVQVDLTDKANKKVKMYMVENDITDKKAAINKILEGLK